MVLVLRLSDLCPMIREESLSIQGLQMRVLALLVIMLMIVPLRPLHLLIPVRMLMSTSGSFIIVRMPVFLLPVAISMPMAVTVPMAVTMSMAVSMPMVEEGVRVKHDFVYQEDEGVATKYQDEG